MAEAIYNQRPSAAAESQLPVAAFKKSLREWQADWQAQHPAVPAVLAVVGKAVKVRPRRRRRKASTAW